MTKRQSENKRYLVSYQTMHDKTFWHTESMYARNEAGAIERFNRFCRKHEVVVTAMRVEAT